MELLPVTEGKKGFVIEDEQGRKIYLDNPSEWSSYQPFSRYGNGVEEGLWVLTSGDVGATYVAIWTRSLEDALEELGAWLKEHAPGRLVDDATLKEYYEDAKEELGADADEDEIRSRAEVDLTYTESGFIPSGEWGYLYDPRSVPDDIVLAAVNVGAAQELEQARGLEDVKATLEMLVKGDSKVPGAKELAEDLANSQNMVVFGDETNDVIALHAGGLIQGTLVSWDTTHAKPFMHEYLFYKDGKFSIIEADKLFPEEHLYK